MTCEWDTYILLHLNGMRAEVFNPDSVRRVPRGKWVLAHGRKRNVFIRDFDTLVLENP